jgi:hypothetical protein
LMMRWACHLFLSLVKKVLGEHVLLLCHWHLGCLGRASRLATSVRLDRLLWNLGALLSNSRSTEEQNGQKSQTRRQKKAQGRSFIRLLKQAGQVPLCCIWHTGFRNECKTKDQGLSSVDLNYVNMVSKLLALK